AAGRPLAEGRATRPGGRGAADRLRVVQPHDAGAQRPPDGGRGVRAEDRPTRRHVPADAPHRVCGAAGAQSAEQRSKRVMSKYAHVNLLEIEDSSNPKTEGVEGRFG